MVLPFHSSPISSTSFRPRPTLTRPHCSGVSSLGSLLTYLLCIVAMSSIFLLRPITLLISFRTTFLTNKLLHHLPLALLMLGTLLIVMLNKIMIMEKETKNVDLFFFVFLLSVFNCCFSLSPNFFMWNKVFFNEYKFDVVILIRIVSIFSKLYLPHCIFIRIIAHLFFFSSSYRGVPLTFCVKKGGEVYAYNYKIVTMICTVWAINVRLHYILLSNLYAFKKSVMWS